MAFIFSTSHLPETRVRRPDHLEDEEDEDVMQPMPRAGGVRAFSHLPPERALADTSGPLSTRPATPAGRPRPYTEPEDDQDTAHAPAPDSEHENDNHAHAEYTDDTPWHSPRITSQDQPPQHHAEDVHAQEAGDHPAPSMHRDASLTCSSGFPQDLRDAFHSTMGEDFSQDNRSTQPYGLRDQRTGQPLGLAGKAEYHDLVHRPGRSPGDGRDQHSGFFQLVGDTRASQPDPSARRAPQSFAQNARLTAQPPAPGAAQNAPAAPKSPAGSGGGDQAGQHPYKIHEADENAEIVRTNDASAPPPQKGAKFGEHARSVINAALDNSPTARAVLNKARELSGKDVVIHSTTATNAQPYIGLDGTIHIFVNPNTLLPGTLAHETAHAIQNWYQQAAERAKRGTGQKLEGKESDAAKLRGRQELHGIAPVTYIDPKSKPEDDTSDNEPRSKSTENEAMRIANIVNAEISAAKVKAKMEAFKKERPEDFEKMSKDPEEMAKSVAQSFWFEQDKLEAISHQTNKHVPMRESTLYGKDGGLKHVLEMLGYGVTAGHIKNAAPLRRRYAPPTPPR